MQPLYLLPASGSEGAHGVPDGEFSATTVEEDSGVYNNRIPVKRPMRLRGFIKLSDGGSVFFAYGGHLYVHDFARDAGVRLDVAQGVAEPEPGEDDAEFLYASTDGSKVLFRDSARLTSVAGGGVYECRVVQDACVGLVLTGLSFSGELIGGSEDGSTCISRMPPGGSKSITTTGANGR